MHPLHHPSHAGLPWLRFPVIRKSKRLKFSKSKLHIKNSPCSDRFDMELNENSSLYVFLNGLQSRPGRPAWEGWHRGRNLRRRCSGEENLSFCILQTPEHSVKCGNSKRKQVDKRVHMSKIWYRLGRWPFGHGSLYLPWFGVKEGKQI